MLRFVISAFIVVATFLSGLVMAPSVSASSLSRSQNTSHMHVTAKIIPARALSSCITVQPGQYLSELFPGNWQSVAVANGISNPDLIYPGQRICDAGGSAVAVPVSYSGKGPNSYPWGWCTWGAEELANRDLNYLGNAGDWAYNAVRRGIPTGSYPQVGATVVFAGGVQGASSLGHVAHVIAVSGSSFEVEEMNNSYLGGFGRYNTNWYHTGWGVSFIY